MLYIEQFYLHLEGSLKLGFPLEVIAEIFEILFYAV